MDLDSCDTFVVLPDSTASGCAIFGKNSDRPFGEVQEVVLRPAQKHELGAKVQVRKVTHFLILRFYCRGLHFSAHTSKFLKSSILFKLY